MANVILLVGYPGSGKGTQGVVLARHLGKPHISSGELFRREVQAGTPVGLEVKKYLDQGVIIPEEVAFPFMRQELAKQEYQGGFILDGYPKDQHSLEFLLGVLDELHLGIAVVLHFDVSANEARRRLGVRMSCPVCDATFGPDVQYCPYTDDHPYRTNGPIRLTPRHDDNGDAIQARLDSFERCTVALLDVYRQRGWLYSLDAECSVDEVTSMALSVLRNIGNNDTLKQQSTKGSYWVSRVPNAGHTKSAVFHNHVDAPTLADVHRLVWEVETRCPTSQTKIYPVTHLTLGPQCRQTTDNPFRDVYRHLPNFHSITDATNEGFATGRMGRDGIDYDSLRTTLEVVLPFSSQNQNGGVMVELEEELYSTDAMTAQVRESTTSVDWQLLGPQWKQRLIDHVPVYELHHGVDIAKSSLVATTTATATTENTSPISPDEFLFIGDNKFDLGGCFIFAHPDKWSYRTNEFSDGPSLDVLVTKLHEQQSALNEWLTTRLPSNVSFAVSSSIEKVHGIWR